MWRVFVVIVVLAGVCARAEAAGNDVQTARSYFQSGTKHFDLGEYEQALSDFKQAYRIKDDPVLLYNIAQCHRMLHHNEEALRAYRTFLSRSTDQSHHADVEQKIAALQEVIDKQTRASTLPPATVLPNKNEPPSSEPSPPANGTPPSEPPPTVSTTLVASRPGPTPVYKKWWFWTAIGGVAVVGVGLGVGLSVGLSSQSSTNTFPAVMY